VPRKRYKNWIEKNVNRLTIHGQHCPRADTDRYLFPERWRKRLDAIRRILHSKVMKMMEKAESKEVPVIHIVRAYQHNTNSPLFQTVNNFRKSFQCKTTRIKDVNVTDNGKRKDTWTSPT
jgi:hypothetical protein